MIPITRPDRLLTKGYQPKIQCAGHLSIGLTPVRFYETLHLITRVLRQYQFDAIAFRGLSGALFAPTVAMEMGKTLLAVRKGEKCHSGNLVEGDYNANRYVILDDFSSSGTTVKNIIEEIHAVMPNAECIGLCEYMYIYDKGPNHLRSVKEYTRAFIQQPKPWSKPSPWVPPVFDVVETSEPANQGRWIRRVNAEPVVV